MYAQIDDIRVLGRTVDRSLRVTHSKNIQQANVLEAVRCSLASNMRWIVVNNTEEAELSFLLSFSWIMISRLGLCT